MVVASDHIDPKGGGSEQLRVRMEKQLIRVALEFYGEEEFFIDKQERKIPDHLHWHARRLRKTKN